jgi:hypothetical protein
MRNKEQYARTLSRSRSLRIGWVRLHPRFLLSDTETGLMKRTHLNSFLSDLSIFDYGFEFVRVFEFKTLCVLINMYSFYCIQ